MLGHIQLAGTVRVGQMDRRKAKKHFVTGSDDCQGGSSRSNINKLQSAAELFLLSAK